MPGAVHAPQRSSRNVPRPPRRRAGRAPGVPVYMRIAETIRRRIADGTLGAGERLPSVRAQAQRLRVNRMTVAHAYRALSLEGLVRGTVGSGTVVTPGRARPRAGDGAPSPALLWSGLARESAGGLSETLRRVEELESAAPADRVTFERAVPDAALLRPEALRDAVAAALAGEGRDLLGAGPAEGHPELRRAVAELLCGRGLRCRPEDVLIVSGVQQGLDLILRAFCEPGDSIVLDDPSYYRSLLLVRFHRLHLLGLPVADDSQPPGARAAASGARPGLERAALLETLLAERPARLLYTVSTFHNPTGRTQSREERLELLAALGQRPLPIVEDDSLWELRYDGRPVAPLHALDGAARVLYVGSFSKILAPGLRLGWVVGPAESLRALTRVKEIADLRGNLLIQAAVARLVLGGHLDEHLGRARRLYRGRRDAMARALQRHFPRQSSWDVPQGGLAFWVSLPPGCDTRRILDRALGRGVAFCPGTLFRAGEGGENEMRLAFGHLQPRQIERGIEALGTLAREEIARTGAPRRAAGAGALETAGPLF